MHFLTWRHWVRRIDRKCTFGHVRPAKIQISLRVRAVWSESSLGAIQIHTGAQFLHSDNKDSNQTARMRRLIWVFVVRTCQKVRFLTLRLIYWVLVCKNYENTPFKYIENFITKNCKFSNTNSDIFHISFKNIDCGYLLEPPRRGGSNEYPHSMFLSGNKKNNVYVL